MAGKLIKHITLIALFACILSGGVLMAQDSENKKEISPAAEKKNNEQNVKIEKVGGGFVFPEGPVWHPDGYLIFSDVHNFTIEKIKPEGGSEVWFDQKRKTNGMIMSNDNKKIYACCYSERCLLEIDAKTKEYKVLADKCDGREFNNVNDVAIDKAGNVYFTDPKWGAKEGDIQGVYCYTKDGKIKLAANPGNQPNGIVASPDGKYMFVDRSGGHDIWKYKITETGELTEGEQWVKLEPGAEPDGMTIDSKGNLYIASAGKGSLIIMSPEKKVINEIKLAEKLVTNCEFEGGREDVLYVTVADKKDKKESSVYKLTFNIK